MHAQRPERVPRCRDRLEAPVHAHIPDLDLAATAAGHELALAATLEVHICDPLPVFAPHLDHGFECFETLVVDADDAVAKAGDEDVAFDLVGG